MIVYHMYVLVSFVHKNHQSFVAVTENEAVGAPVLEMWEGMEELWQDVLEGMLWSSHSAAEWCLCGVRCIVWVWAVRGTLCDHENKLGVSRKASLYCRSFISPLLLSVHYAVIVTSSTDWQQISVCSNKMHFIRVWLLWSDQKGEDSTDLQRRHEPSCDEWSVGFAWKLRQDQHMKCMG